MLGVGNGGGTKASTEANSHSSQLLTSGGGSTAMILAPRHREKRVAASPRPEWAHIKFLFVCLFLRQPCYVAQDDLGLLTARITSIHQMSWAVMVHTFNPSTPEAKVGWPLSVRTACSTGQAARATQRNPLSWGRKQKKMCTNHAWLFLLSTKDRTWAFHTQARPLPLSYTLTVFPFY